MSRRRDTPDDATDWGALTPRQRFTRLVLAEREYRRTTREWSTSKFIEESGVGRTTMYEWFKKDSERMPEAETVREYATNLDVPIEPYAEALGWTKKGTIPSDPALLGNYIARLRGIAGHPGTSARRRRELEERIRTAQRMQKSASEARLSAAQMERAATELLREALGESEDADT